jgi:UDP-3-O-[3-hydroxymyristoyl] glucosamine N-acyltransferase
VDDGTQRIALSTLAEMTGGQVIGDAHASIRGVCSLDHPRPGCIAMALEGVRISWAEDSARPAALIVSSPLEGFSLPFLVHKNPRTAFAIALGAFHQEHAQPPGIHPSAIVDPEAEIGEDAWIGPLTVIEAGARIGSKAQVWPGTYVGRNSIIGSETKLFPNVTVMHDVTIGARCSISSGVVIGSDGFGFTQTESGNMKVPQIGRVVIGDDVEIGANTTIDRATLDETVISDDVKIDNLVQIAHNVKIGPHTRIAAQAGLSGRAEIGANVVIAGQAGFQNGIKVGDGCMIAGRAAVIGDIPAGSRVSGYPARDHRKALKILALQNRLPEILDRLEKVEQRVTSKPDGY